MPDWCAEIVVSREQGSVYGAQATVQSGHAIVESAQAIVQRVRVRDWWAAVVVTREQAIVQSQAGDRAVFALWSIRIVPTRVVRGGRSRGVILGDGTKCPSMS